MNIERVDDGDRDYCLIIRAAEHAEATQFLGSDDDPLQVGFIRRAKGEQILPHVHLVGNRHISQTWEFLLVRRGAMKMHIYDDELRLLADKTLNQGDAVLLMGGGHSFEALDELELLEVKQGPYLGDGDKRRFEAKHSHNQ